MELKPAEISRIIREKILDFENLTDSYNQGTIIGLHDGIVRIHGLTNVMYGEIIEFPNLLYGIALNLEKSTVGAIVLGDYKKLCEGQLVKCTGKILEIPVGESLLGRVVDSLGNPVDGKGEILTTETSPIERDAPNVISRQSVSSPIQTGIKAIDSMVPIGKGQRELIIGDRQTGKTSIAIDAIINQKNKNIICVYVAICQKQSTIAHIVNKLDEYDALNYTIIVNASASSPVSMQYISPYSGCAIGEYFRDKGMDALIIYDDLTKHTWAYRQISLLLQRPPGREAYPGDIFYLHSRLLERASCVNKEYIEKNSNGKIKGKTGSLTALPIIETQAGDVSSFVPTNVISITDGQIFLQTDLFYSGIRPAINTGLSVSRIGGAAQTKIIKKLSAGIRIGLAQYRELEAFSQFASDLDVVTRKQLERGERSMEIMKQKQYLPLSVAEMAFSLFIITKGYLDDISIKDISKFETQLHGYIKENYKQFFDHINNNPDYTNKIEEKMDEIVISFKKIF